MVEATYFQSREFRNLTNGQQSVLADWYRGCVARRFHGALSKIVKTTELPGFLFSFALNGNPLSSEGV